MGRIDGRVALRCGSPMVPWVSGSVGSLAQVGVGMIRIRRNAAEPEAMFERRPRLLLFQPAQVRGKVCKVLPVTHAFGGSADSSLDSIVVEVVGEVAHQAGVVHAKRGGGELGIEVGDELGESGLPAGRRCGPAGGECSGQVGAGRACRGSGSRR